MVLEYLCLTQSISNSCTVLPVKTNSFHFALSILKALYKMSWVSAFPPLNKSLKNLLQLKNDINDCYSFARKRIVLAYKMGNINLIVLFPYVALLNFFIVFWQEYKVYVLALLTWLLCSHCHHHFCSLSLLIWDG